MRNSGSVIGGAINFATNHDDSNGGGIAWSTYLIFVGFGKQTSSIKCSCITDRYPAECTGVIWAFLLTATRKVLRRDGTRIPMQERITWKQELIALKDHFLYSKVSVHTP